MYLRSLCASSAILLFIISSFDTEFRDVNSFMGASNTMRVYANKVSNEIGIDVDIPSECASMVRGSEGVRILADAQRVR